MSSLYTQRDKNIHRTWLFLTGFLLFIIGVGWLISYVVGSEWILYLAVALALVINFLSYWYSDKIVLKTVRARKAEKKDYPELHRVVENLAITAGLPKPEVFIIDDPQPNAFATGRDPRHAAVAVTRGLVNMMDRSELEGVLAHELSHIGNRDMLLTTIAVVMASFVTILANIFLRSRFYGFGGKREGSNQLQAIVAVIAVLVALIAPLAATLLRLAISRKREFLADASGVLLTRYPEGLVSALTKIEKYPRSMRHVNNAVATLFIANPLRGKRAASWLAKLFMTHPPIEERIKALRELEV